MEVTFVAESPQEELQGFQFHAGAIRHITNPQRGKIRLPGDGTHAGELVSHAFNHVSAPRSGISEGFEICHAGILLIRRCSTGGLPEKCQRFPLFYILHIFTRDGVNTINIAKIEAKTQERIDLAFGQPLTNRLQKSPTQRLA